MRALLRGLGYVVSELVPAQALRVALNRDFHRVLAERDVAQHQAEVLRDALTQYEEENECWEPPNVSVDAPRSADTSPTPVEEPSPPSAAPGVGPLRDLEARVAALEAHRHHYLAPGAQCVGADWQTTGYPKDPSK